MTSRACTRLLLTGLAAALSACSDAASDFASDVVDAGDTSVDITTEPGDTTDPGDSCVPDDSSVPGDTVDPGDPGPFEWPVPTAPMTIAPDASWKDAIALPWDPFIAYGAGDFGVRWVKFTVLLRDPTRVYFQDSSVYQFHQPFALDKLTPFKGMTASQFDQATLYESGQEAILGALLIPSDGRTAEYGIQLVRQDAYHPEMVRQVIELVRKAVVLTDGGGSDTTTAVTSFYMPTFEQAASARVWTAWLKERGVEVSSTDRWLAGDQCYAAGWALGRLVSVPGDQIDEAYADGTLLATDILLTDGVPAEVPFLAGIISTAASTPNSHVAILANTYGVPFVYLAGDSARATALVGKTVYVRTRLFGDQNGLCAVDIVDASEIPSADQSALIALKAPPALDFPPKASPGVLVKNADVLTPGDARYFGGKAANFGLLRDAIPDHSPAAAGVSFDLWDAFMGQTVTVDGNSGTLASAIARRLAVAAGDASGVGTPSFPIADLGAFFTGLGGIRDLIRDEVAIPDSTADALLSQLALAFDPNVRLRFRSSTNVEDGASFSGAGLYDSYTGCLADDLDDDDVGPSACQPDRLTERSALEAIRKTIASFYNDNATLERLRRGVDPGKVGMALLVNPSFPDETEAANGVATVTVATGGPKARMTFVTQKGSLSVTNPDSAATPEVYRYDLFGSFDSASLLQPSSLVPIGALVLGTAERYEELAGLIVKVQAAFEAAHPQKTEYTLDLEYKAIGEAEALVIKQVREVPRSGNTAPLVPYLAPVTLERCSFQGEYGSTIGAHRTKSQWTLSALGGFLTEERLGSTLYEDLTVTLAQQGAIATHSGAPASLPGASHSDGESTFMTGLWETVDEWDVAPLTPDGPSRRVRIVTSVPKSMDARLGPLVLPSDVTFRVGLSYASPVPTLEDWEPFEINDEENLLTDCPGDGPFLETPRTYEETVTADGPAKGVTIATGTWYPLPPKGISAGYTAPLGKWAGTTITGLTSEPIALTGFFSQTFRPLHHNFTESFVFEPRLEDGLPQAVKDELTTKDIGGVLFVTGDGNVRVDILDLELQPKK